MKTKYFYIISLFLLSGCSTTATFYVTSINNSALDECKNYSVVPIDKSAKRMNVDCIYDAVDAYKVGDTITIVKKEFIK